MRFEPRYALMRNFHPKTVEDDGLKYTSGSLVHIEDRNGLVAMVQQVCRKAWSLPGGFRSFADGSSEDTAVREVLEETGIRFLKLISPLELVDRYRQDNVRHIDHLYRVRLSESAPDMLPVGIKARLETRAVRWVVLQDPNDRPIMKHVTRVALTKIHRLPGYELDR